MGRFLALLLCPWLAAAPAWAAAPEARAVAAAHDVFLEDLSRRSFLYFWDQADPKTGLVLDRAPTGAEPFDGRKPAVASMAATGFGLTAICIATQHGWLKPDLARLRVRRTLRFLAQRAPQVHGWFCHFVSTSDGERRWASEVSSIDTALLLAGALVARQCFRDDAQIVRSATAVYERVDFPWMLAGRPALFSMGWTPERGFLPARWDSYSEHMMLTLLAVGSPTHPVPAEVWKNWRRDKIVYGDVAYYSSAGPLFIHQFSQAWVDFRGRRDLGFENSDYFENSVKAIRAHRQFNIDLGKKFKSYSDNIWGITSSEGPKGYMTWGGPPADLSIDGTVVPCAAGGSLMFAPDIALPALEAMKQRYGRRIYGRYGFADAFNPATGWVAPDVLGIDQGITLLSAENLHSAMVWKWFMANPEIIKAMEAVGLRKSLS